VADFQVPLSLGTQNGGSVIRPASYTGIFAMKPTHNAISAEGVKLVSFNIDTCGFFARSIEDLQLVADVFAFKSDESLSTFFLQDARIAFVRTPFWNMVGDGTVKAMSRAADILAKHGAIVEDVELPPQLNDAQALKRTQKIVLNVEAQAAFLKEYRMDKTKLDPKICGFVENQSNFTIEEMACAMDTYNNMRSEFDKFAAGYAAIIAPSAQDVAPLGLGDMGDSSLNFLWTVSIVLSARQAHADIMTRDSTLLPFTSQPSREKTVFLWDFLLWLAGIVINTFSGCVRFSANL
jgi:Asp-tRNA(Asn)/Glu-tRNA(Gln) amidotransferase A subunit family amidase